MKLCTKCGETKPTDQFSKNKSRKDGLATMCKQCWTAYYKEYYKNGKERARLASNRKSEREEIRKFIQEIKNVPCVDCGVSYPYYVMQFDHRDPTQKLFNIGAKMGSHSLSKIKAEVAKCDVVCANCHAERTWGAIPV